MHFTNTRRQPPPLPQHPQDAPRSPPRSPRQSCHLLPHENPSAVRMREASTRNGMGGQLPGRSHQRHLHATDLVSAVPSVSALLPAQHGPVQGQVAWSTRECCEAGVATVTDYADEQPQPGGTVVKLKYGESSAR